MPSTAHTEPIPHAARCKRPAPVLRLSWRRTPDGGCGRHLDLPIPTDTTATDKETAR